MVNTSRPSRGAWIETHDDAMQVLKSSEVAPLTGRVD